MDRAVASRRRVWRCGMLLACQLVHLPKGENKIRWTCKSITLPLAAYYGMPFRSCAHAVAKRTCIVRMLLHNIVAKRMNVVTVESTILWSESLMVTSLRLVAAPTFKTAAPHQPPHVWMRATSIPKRFIYIGLHSAACTHKLGHGSCRRARHYVTSILPFHFNGRQAS